MSDLPTLYGLQDRPLGGLSEHSTHPALFLETNKLHCESGTFVIPLAFVGQGKASTRTQHVQAVKTNVVHATALHTANPVDSMASTPTNQNKAPAMGEDALCNSLPSCASNNHAKSSAVTHEQAETVQEHSIAKNNAEDLPQILCVKSLAGEIKCDKTIATISSPRKKRKSEQLHVSVGDAVGTSKHVVCGKRLRVEYDSRRRKKILKLIWKDTISVAGLHAEAQELCAGEALIEPYACCNFIHHVKMGLPALTCCRPKLKANQLVEKCGCFCRHKKQPLRCPANSSNDQTNTLPQPSVNANCGIAKTAVTQSNCKLVKESQGDLKPIPYPSGDGLCSTKRIVDLHSSTQCNVADAKLTSSSHTSIGTWRLSLECNRTTVAETGASACHTNARRYANSKIERLKEIIRQRERKLEEVRRNYGFIS